MLTYTVTRESGWTPDPPAAQPATARTSAATPASARLAEERCGNREFLGWDGAQLGDCLLQRDQLDPSAAQGRHHPPLPLVRGVDRRDAEPRGQHAVVSRRRPATLDVPEHDRASLEPRPLLDLALEAHADATQPRVAELVELPVRRPHLPLLRDGALGGHDDGEEASARVTAPDQLADVVDVKGALGD